MTRHEPKFATNFFINLIPKRGYLKAVPNGYLYNGLTARPFMDF